MENTEIYTRIQNSSKITGRKWQQKFFKGWGVGLPQHEKLSQRVAASGRLRRCECLAELRLGWDWSEALVKRRGRV